MNYLQAKKMRVSKSCQSGFEIRRLIQLKVGSGCDSLLPVLLRDHQVVRELSGLRLGALGQLPHPVDEAALGPVELSVGRLVVHQRRVDQRGDLLDGAPDDEVMVRDRFKERGTLGDDDGPAKDRGEHSNLFKRMPAGTLVHVDQNLRLRIKLMALLPTPNVVNIDIFVIDQSIEQLLTPSPGVDKGA